MSELPRTSTPTADADEALAEVVAEVTDRLHAGQPVDLESCLARYPDRAEQLRRLLPALELLNGLGSSADPDDAPRRTADGRADTVAGVLGDFRIVREVGRAGGQ